jgi:hypothetical protein
MQWVKEGTTEQDYGRDYSECLALAHGSSGGYPTAGGTNIYQPPQPGGSFMSGFNSGMSMAASMSAARDRGARRGAIAEIQYNCMIGRGSRVRQLSTEFRLFYTPQPSIHAGSRFSGA